jgi:Protein of unknown function (DUF2975)
MDSQPYCDSHPTSLGLSRQVLTVLVKLNLLMGLLITALLIASLVAEGPVFHALGVRGKGDNSTLILGMRAIAVIGICAVPLAHIILTRLLSMVDTVRNGDPFVAENADRLQTIAWSVLVLEVMHAVVGIVAARVSTTSQPLDIHWSFSVTRWLVVLLLFVLARVFDQGTRMREELEATV